MGDEELDEESSEELEPSTLGTKQHWETTYSMELQNFHENGDPGEVWFGFQCQRRIVSWLDKYQDVGLGSRIVDLGCGNGAMLLQLAEQGYSNLVGVDYSPNAIKLADQLTSKEGADRCCVFRVVDVLDTDSLPADLGPVDVLLDKGTYDAVSMNPDSPGEKRRKYRQSCLALLRENGILVIASCNWTEEELKEHFEHGYQPVDVIPSPSFKFGGRTGQSVSTVVFKKR